MLQCRWMISLCLLAASPALAQTNQEGSPPERMGQKPGGPVAQRPIPIGNIATFVEKMKSDLKLDENQQTAVQVIMKDHEKMMQDLRNEMKQSPETLKQMNELRERMKKATDANDQAALKQTGEEMQKLRKEHMEKITPARDKMVSAQDGLKDRFRSVMHDGQKADFDKLWADYMAPASSARTRSNPRLLRSLVERLPDLTSEQKKQVNDLYKQYDDAAKSQKDGTPAIREDQNRKLTDGVLAVLTPTQRERIEARLQGKPDRATNGSHKPEQQPEGVSNPNSNPPSVKP